MNNRKAALIAITLALFAFALSFVVLNNTSESVVSAQDSACEADESWISNPTMPTEIPDGGQTLCDFYQFSWQGLIQLMSDSGNSQREFQNPASYTQFLANGQDSCSSTETTPQFFIRVDKDDDGIEDDFITLDEFREAGNSGIIYDQAGNVVVFEVRFSNDMCSYTYPAATSTPANSDSTPTSTSTIPPTNFPSGTTELKIAWRFITEDEKSSYVWINADVNNDGVTDETELLGLIGFHFVRNTDSHPEFVWATFEHKNNAPDCQSSTNSPDGWAFASSSCTAELPDPSSDCSFNTGITVPTPTPIPLTGTPSEICRVYPYGTRSGDHEADENINDITSLNGQLTEMFSSLDSDNPLAVLQNYELIGALWLNDPSHPPSYNAPDGVNNQRGSIQLANTVMETSMQQGYNTEYTGSTTDPALNCFGCHQYNPGDTGNGLSHIYSHIHGSSSDE